MDWNDLQHLEGAAGDVPKLLKLLFAKDETKVDEGFERLHTKFVAEQEVSALPALVSELLDRLPKAPHKTPVLVLVAECLAGGILRHWLCSTPPDRKAVREIFVPRADVVAKLSRDKNGSMRAAAAIVLSVSRLPTMVEPLSTLARSDPDPVVRASAILALAPLSRERSEEVLRSTPGSASVVLAAQSLARLRIHPSRSLESERDGLAAWLSLELAPEGETELGWFGLSWPSFYHLDRPHDLVAETVAALARARSDEDGLSRLMLEIGTLRAPGAASRRAGALVADLGGLEGRWKSGVVQQVVELTSMSERARATARSLSATSLLPEATRGLPASGIARRRWAGLDSPGPLEAAVEARDRNGNTLSGPRYLVALRDPLDLWGVLTHGLTDALARWETALLWLARSYGGMEERILAPEKLEAWATELVSLGDEGLDRARRVLDDLAARFAASDAEGQPSRCTPLVTTLALLPFVRANATIPRSWEPLVTLGLGPLLREVLAALSGPSVEEILFRYECRHPAAGVAGTKEALSALDLGLSRRNVDALLARLDHAAVVAFYRTEIDAMRDRVRSLGAQLPGG
jgi:hypothetical protein